MEIVVMIVVGLLAAAYVMIPLVRRRPAVAWDWDGAAGGTPEERRAALEDRILEYRAALRAGTICTRCGLANAETSRFCAECGRPLVNAPQDESGTRSGTESEAEPVSG